MFNENSEEKVRELVDLELEVAKQYGNFYASNHEGWAVLREEVDEAGESASDCKMNFHRLWALVTGDAPKEQFLREIKSIKGYAKKAILEFAQVMAVCEKFETTLNQEKRK